MTDIEAPRVLIAYYSRSGVTRDVATALARACGGELEQIADFIDRRGLLGYLRSGYEALSRSATRIREPRYDPSRFDVLVIATPTWGAALASPVRSYVLKVLGRLPEVAFIVTCDAQGGAQVIEQLRELTRKPPLATLVLRHVDVRAGPAELIGEFVERFSSSWERRRKSPVLAAVAATAKS